jgi:hypothetical protein
LNNRNLAAVHLGFESKIYERLYGFSSIHELTWTWAQKVWHSYSTLNESRFPRSGDDSLSGVPAITAVK